MNLNIMTPSELREAYETDLREAFPPSELKPLAAMEGMRERGIYEPLRLTGDGGEPVGYMLLWKHPEEPYVLVDYLCVPARLRGRGVGGQLIAMVRQRYPADTVFIGESEAPGGGRDYPAPPGFLSAHRGRAPGLRHRPVRRPLQDHLLGGEAAG